MKHLLYMKETCPYCQKVISYLEEKNFECKMLDVSDPVNMDELLVVGGKDQVPFFVDTENDIKMYESEDIINYIENL